MDPYDCPLGCHNLTSCFQHCENGYDYESYMQEKADAAMPWIGMYIAAASAICSLAMAADAFNGFRSKKLWFPCKYFALNATSLTLLAVTMKLTVDLTSVMLGLDDELAKVSSLVLMSTAMSNSMTSLASMDNNEILLNVTALAILVFTIAGNVCIHYVQIDGRTSVLPEVIVVTVILFLLLIILCCSSLVIPTAKRCIDSKYREMHKIDQVEGGDCRLTINEMRIMIQRYWVMAQTGSPQFVMARSVLSASSGLICLLMALTLVEAHIRLYMSYYMRGDLLVYKWVKLMATDYKWSIIFILYIQSSGVLLGTIAPVLRWFFAARFKISETGLKSLRDELKIERYWTLRLVEWRESSLHLRIRHHRCRKLLHDAKWLLLSICIGVQILVVLISKLILVISAICGNAIFLCFHHIKILKRPDSRASNEGSDLNRYVLLLDGEGELPKKILINICNEVDKLIQTGRGRQPKNLFKLLNMSKNFDGVIKFDNNKDVPSLDSQEPPNCWSLPVVTLTSIAIALPNITKDKFNELLSGVSEGLYFVKLIEKYMDGDGELTSIRNAADAVWVGVELYNKWQDKDILETSQNGQSYIHVLQELSNIAKKTVEDFKAGTKDFLMQNPLNWPVKVIVANSMYRITQTVLLAHKDNDQATDEEVFDRLSAMISDIFAACLTNLVHFIRFECHNNVIKERVKRVGQVAVILGKSEEIIEILQQRELPALCMDPAKAANIEEWRRALMEVDNENPLVFISAVSSNEMLVPQSNGEHVSIELGSYYKCIWI